MRGLTLPDIKTYCKAAEGVSGSGLTTLETVWHCFFPVTQNFCPSTCILERLVDGHQEACVNLFTAALFAKPFRGTNTHAHHRRMGTYIVAHSHNNENKYPGSIE